MAEIVKIKYKNKKAYKLLLCLEEIKFIEIIDGKLPDTSKKARKKQGKHV